jgi:seryl-tRNA synthetase
LAALWEHGRQADGSVKIPDALLPYMRGHKVIPAP